MWKKKNREEKYKKIIKKKPIGNCYVLVIRTLISVVLPLTK